MVNNLYVEWWRYNVVTDLCVSITLCDDCSFYESYKGRPVCVMTASDLLSMICTLYGPIIKEIVDHDESDQS